MIKLQKQHLTCLKWCLEISKRSPRTDVNVSSYSSLTSIKIVIVIVIAMIFSLTFVGWNNNMCSCIHAIQSEYQLKNVFSTIIFVLFNNQKIFSIFSKFCKQYLLRPQVILPRLNQNRITNLSCKFHFFFYIFIFLLKNFNFFL